MGFQIKNVFSLFSGKDVIGIDLGKSSIKIVRLKKSGSSWTVVNCHWEELPPKLWNPENQNLEDIRSELSKKIRDILNRKFSGVNRFSTTLNGNQVIVRNVKFPKIKKEELEKNLQFEAEPYIAFDIRDVYLAFQILKEAEEEGEQKWESILVGVKKELLDQRLSFFQELGLKPVVVDVDAFSIQNLYELNSDDFAQNTILFLNIGSSVTNILITEKGYPKVARDLLMGGYDITRTLMNTLRLEVEEAEELKKKYGIVSSMDLQNMDDPEKAEEVSTIVTNIANELLNEVRRSLDYFHTVSEHEGEINRIVLSGGGSKLRNLEKYLQAQLNFPVEFLDPWKKIKQPEDALIKEKGLDLAVALGTALRNG